MVADSSDTKRDLVTMSTISNAPTLAQGVAGHSRVGGLAASLKQWWIAYINRRIERAAIAELWSMSDMELKDIGLTRSGITNAVTAGPSATVEPAASSASKEAAAAAAAGAVLAKLIPQVQEQVRIV